MSRGAESITGSGDGRFRDCRQETPPLLAGLECKGLKTDYCPCCADVVGVDVAPPCG
jgi:hypothetical protein